MTLPVLIQSAEPKSVRRMSPQEFFDYVQAEAKREGEKKTLRAIAGERKCSVESLLEFVYRMRYGQIQQERTVPDGARENRLYKGDNAERDAFSPDLLARGPVAIGVLPTEQTIGDIAPISDADTDVLSAIVRACPAGIYIHQVEKEYGWRTTRTRLAMREIGESARADSGVKSILWVGSASAAIRDYLLISREAYNRHLKTQQQLLQ